MKRFNLLIAAGLLADATLPYQSKEDKVKNAWSGVALGICFLIAIVSPAGAQAQTAASVIVDCGKGQTITDALARAQGVEELEIQFSGGCRERILIVRDRLTLRGVGGDAVLFGYIDVEGASEVTLRDFSIRDGGIVPSARFGSINVTQGAAASLLNLKIEDFPGRGVRVVSATADIQDVTVERTAVGFEFSLAQVNLAGTLVAKDNAVGMLLLTSGVVAARTDLSFSGNIFGLIVELSSSFSHFRGQLNATGNQIGVLLSGQGTYAHAAFVDIRDNQTHGLIIEELSNLTPFRGAPGGGPVMSITGNPVGISVTKGSTLEVIAPTTVTANGVGLEVDESLARLEGATIHSNGTADMTLGFSARATFLGEGNSLGSPMQCHETALVRGTIGCGAPLKAAEAASSSRLSERLDPRELLSRILQ